MQATAAAGERVEMNPEDANEAELIEVLDPFCSGFARRDPEPVAARSACRRRAGSGAMRRHIPLSLSDRTALPRGPAPSCLGAALVTGHPARAQRQMVARAVAASRTNLDLGPRGPLPLLRLTAGGSRALSSSPARRAIEGLNPAVLIGADHELARVSSLPSKRPA